MEIVTYIVAIIAFLITKTILAMITTVVWNLILTKINNKDMSSSKWTQFTGEFTAAFFGFIISIKIFSLFDIEPNLLLFAAICLIITRMLLFSDSARTGFNKGNKNAVNSSFLAIYQSKLIELGIPKSEIDMETEHLRKDEPIRRTAFEYAENEVRNLNVEDEYNPTSQMLGNILGVGIYLIITLN
jgi:dolichyl-phosphate-mannose--protein O-mannosyl transferase